MHKTQNFHLSALIFILIMLSSCGRKSRNIFTFTETPCYKIRTLDLPAPHNISCTHKTKGITIAWSATSREELSLEAAQSTTNIRLEGYNVYRLTPHGFIPKKPLNQTPIQELNFIDEAPHEAHTIHISYLVKAVFKIGKKLKEGPGSTIVFVEKK